MGVHTLIVMGPSGCGKTTLSSFLQRRTGWYLIEGDDFHSAENIAKLAAGVPLTDYDRLDWLQAIRDEIILQNSASRSVIVTCSALKRNYRNIVSEGGTGTLFVYLKTTEDVLRTRTFNRKGHFVSPKIVTSQLEILEPPTPDENALTVDATLPVDHIVSTIFTTIGYKSQ